MKNYLSKILITGGQGQIASALRHHPLARAFELQFCSHQEMDITNIAAIESALNKYNPDMIINTAAYTAVDKAEQEREQAQQANYIAVKNLAMRCNHLPFIHLSTDYIFDGKTSLPYREEDSANPINFYGETKRLAEAVITAQMKNYIILRLSGIFSEFGHNFLKSILRLAQEKKTLTIVNDQITCPTYADDIAQTILTIASQYGESKKPPNGIYHYCSSSPVSWYEFATAIIDEVKLYKELQVTEIKPISSTEYKTAAKRPPYSVLACDKILLHFGIQQPSWKIGIHNAVKLWLG